ncbi:hypothetical protein HY489_06105 [Candidatus Woesearchaeota archaeon]|nr:hypothetical protein [Candidatus Woesearchaeota archaeon]
MKRLVAILLIFSLFSVPVLGYVLKEYKTSVVAERRLGEERVTHYDPRVQIGKINTVAHLEPHYTDIGVGVGRGGYAPVYPRGTAKVESSEWHGYPRGNVVIKVKELPYTERTGEMFEAWLVDLETGYRLSVGTFLTLLGGVGELRYSANTYFDAYDVVEVTVEPLGDLDPTPGAVVLSGPIAKPDYYNPPAKSSKMLTDVIRDV